MSPVDLYLVAGVALFVFCLWGVLARAHLFWKLLCVNIMASGNFLILVSAAPRSTPGTADPIPQAMVLTGIVVAVASTAVGLGIALRIVERTGRPFLRDDGAPATETGASEARAESADA